MVYEQIKAKLPQRFFPKSENPPVVEPEPILTPVTLQPPMPVGVDIIYHKYRCWTGNTLSCEWTEKTIEQNPTAKTCQTCGFPAIIPAKTEFRGYKGRYRIDKYIGNRGLGRLYQGIQLTDQQPAIIKEYLLPQLAFNAEETRDRKQAFERLAGLSLADGRIQDIRLNFPWDAISDPIAERCYLVTNGNIDAYPTLRTYLKATNKPMSEREVYRVLDQGLQTLQFLHGQKFSLPTGQIQQGIAHGNINLDSLLIMADTAEFFIHLTDLTLWENLFQLSTIKPVVSTVAQDLVDLGYVAFYLLQGNILDTTIDPRKEQYWQAITLEFKAFLFRLLGLDKPFNNAEEAREALLQVYQVLPREILIIPEQPETPKAKLYRPSILLLSILGGLLLCGLIVWLVQRWKSPETVMEEPVVCCLKSVTGVPGGKFNYTGEKDSTWSFIRRQSNLILQNQTLEEKLKASQPKLQLNYQPEDSIEQAIASVKDKQKDFAIANMVEPLTPELKHQEFAYDGLVVFVAFSYSKRDKSLPRALNGQISIQQLQDLYTGKITNWQQLKGFNLPKLPVNLYIPKDAETIRIFEQRVLRNEEAIATFRYLKQQQQSNTSFTYSGINITSLSTLEMLQKVLRDFEEDNIGSIGFATLSQVFGQCSVYPLAIADKDKAAVQTLVQDNGKPINPNTDLCDDKGSYQPNIQVFKTGSYPLSYPLVVLYPGDNSRPPIGQKFAEMLRTAEVQQILEKTGLVPLSRQ
ncbi:substrate-binding domain-containing protein [Nostoc sp. FACHB-87]|uniref:substrate-binding domain-containing protein n=1 Tax=Nostocaceae TaxID=1162 RepID=UPI0016861F7F|nr:MULTISPECIES: substrate-binding domain-containing protein [Nostocaceae]MBD2454648.1 substrate-binding domain-containing protein [Nostoc sp. FACHB-87]MBD2475933.1 substrate-binding domain-containing protein [Anabaena sp. FACHB-83]